MRHTKMSLPDKPASNPIGIPNNELGSLSGSRHAGHGIPPIRRALGLTQFTLLISGNRGGLDLVTGAARVRWPPRRKGSAIGAVSQGSHTSRKDYNEYFNNKGRIDMARDEERSPTHPLHEKIGLTTDDAAELLMDRSPISTEDEDQLLTTPTQVESSCSDLYTIIRTLRGITHKYCREDRSIKLLRRVLWG